MTAPDTAPSRLPRDALVVLVTDRIYAKTARFITKLRGLMAGEGRLLLAIVDGFGEGPAIGDVCDDAPEVIAGSIPDLADTILRSRGPAATPPCIVALNQSAVLPGLALRLALGLGPRPGLAEACDKRLTRRRLAQGDLHLDFVAVRPGEALGDDAAFEADRYVVKPAFGTSGKHVRFFDTWTCVREFVRDSAGPRSEATVADLSWAPAHVLAALGVDDPHSDAWIVEPYVAGPEFSVDGWIRGGDFSAIVQHKFSIVETATFVGDGPTITPPAGPADLPPRWQALRNGEAAIRDFGRRVLGQLGFTEGVFHIEGRERSTDGRLFLVEVNPRAPGGSLWRSAERRTGLDLETVDAAIQLGLAIPPPDGPIAAYALHYPFYARRPGVLKDWGDLTWTGEPPVETLSVDFAAALGQIFAPTDLDEEPYLAFAVVHDDTLAGLLEKCDRVLGLTPPRLDPFGGAEPADRGGR